MADTDKVTNSASSINGLDFSTNVSIQRRLYTQDLVDREYEDITVKLSTTDRLRSACTCSCSRVFKVLLAYFPIIGVIQNYAGKKDAPNDFVAGLSVSFMHMPQGLALGLLASVPPVFGLYSSFYPVLLYVLFGTCRHISMGTNALLSLLTAGIVQRELEACMAGNTGHSTGSVSLGGVAMTTTVTESVVTMSVEEQNAFKVGVATAVALMSGAILLCMGFLKLGFITCYLSTSFVGGFTTAAAVQIATSQIPKMLHINIPSHSGPGKVVRTYIDIFGNITDSNLADVIISAISLVFLLTVTILVNEKYRTKLRVPIPLDLIIVVVSTLISHLANLKDMYGVAVVGDIPIGLPAPTLPNTQIIGRIAVDAFVMAILIFTLSIALAKLMADKHNYSIDPDQELVAYGMCNVVGSFFRCFSVCTGPPRTMILNNIGARSTLNGIVTSLVILMILLAAGQLFVSLPIAVLAAMICAAMKDLLLQVKQLPDLWQVSKPDFCVWVITCMASIFIDLDIGIAVGVGISILAVIVRNQLASGTVGGLSKTEDLVLFGKGKDCIRGSEAFRIFHFPAQLFFANADNFAKEIFSKTVDPSHANTETLSQKVDTENHNDSEISRSESSSVEPYEDVKFVILECSAITYIDLAGVNVLKRVSSRYQKVGVTLLLAKCPAYTLKVLDRAGYFKTIDRNTVFADVYDAIACVQQGSV